MRLDRGTVFFIVIGLAVVAIAAILATGIENRPLLHASPGPAASSPENSSLSSQYITVETDSAPGQYLPDQARVSNPRYYRTANWTMPVPAPDMLGQPHHGIIYELDYQNPLNESITISVRNIKCAFYETKSFPGEFVPSHELFYSDSEGFFTAFNLPAHGQRTVLLYAYISTDSDYDEYSGYFMEPVSISIAPG